MPLSEREEQQQRVRLEKRPSRPQYRPFPTWNPVGSAALPYVPPETHKRATHTRTYLALSRAGRNNAAGHCGSFANLHRCQVRRGSVAAFSNLSSPRSSHSGRLLATPLIDVPEPASRPDYYELVNPPISLNTIDVRDFAPRRRWLALTNFLPPNRRISARTRTHLQRRATVICIVSLKSPGSSSAQILRATCTAT